MAQPDVALGKWVYCKSHVGPHMTGWCSVNVDNKVPLEAQEYHEAMEESWAKGFRIFGYCDICHDYIANDWPFEKVCPKHAEESALPE